MSSIPWLIIAVGVLLIIGLIVFFLVVRKQKKRPTDYYNLFVIGIIWTAFGIVLRGQMYFFFILGLVFMGIGLAHKKEWKKNRVRWEDLTPRERKFKTWLIVVLVILVLVGAVAFFYVNSKVNNISNFEECIAAGNPAMESYPRQCRAGDKTFTEQIDDTILTAGDQT